MPDLTYLDMQSRIARELRRTDLGTEIQGAIADAIRHFKDERFPINVAKKQWTAVANQRNYALPTDFSTHIHVTATYAGSVTVLKEVPLLTIDFWDQTGSPTAQHPEFYTVFGLNLEVWPRFAATSGTNTLDMPYVSNLAAPTEDSTAGFWMNEAESLIRCYAKHRIFGDVLYVPEMAEYQLKLANAELERLSEVGFARALPMHIVPTEMI